MYALVLSIIIGVLTGTLMVSVVSGRLLFSESVSAQASQNLRGYELDFSILEQNSPQIFRYEVLGSQMEGTVSMQTDVLSNELRMVDTWDLECGNQKIEMIVEESTHKNLFLSPLRFVSTVKTSSGERVCDISPVYMTLKNEDSKWTLTVNGKLSGSFSLPTDLTSDMALFRLVSLLPCDEQEPIQMEIFSVFSMVVRDSLLRCEFSGLVASAKKFTLEYKKGGEWMTFWLDESGLVRRAMSDKRKVFHLIEPAKN